MARATKSYKRAHGLTVRQQSAIALLLLGKTAGETAATVGVHRGTIARWLSLDPWFEGELNRRRAELWEGALERVRALVPRALDALECELRPDSSRRLQAAAHLLKAAGLESLGDGPSTRKS